MSLNSMIISALTGIVDADPDESADHLPEYATFNYDEIPDDHGDDEPQATRYLCQVHYYAPIAQNTIARRTAIKTAICTAGFTAPSVLNLTDRDRYADPVKRQHFVFEFEYAGDPE